MAERLAHEGQRRYAAGWVVISCALALPAGFALKRLMSQFRGGGAAPAGMGRSGPAGSAAEESGDAHTPTLTQLGGT